MRPAYFHAQTPTKSNWKSCSPTRRCGVGAAAPRWKLSPPGFAALDAGLPGGGWPRHGLVEILTPQPGVGELYLLLPALAALSRLMPARWCTWVSPPHEPFAPALEAHGVALDRMLIVRTHLPLWAHEQALRSGACEVALAWLPRASPRAMRRLQLAAEQGRALGVLVSQPAIRAAKPHRPCCG